MFSTFIICFILLNICVSEMCFDLSWYCIFVWCRFWGGVEVRGYLVRVFYFFYFRGFYLF